MLKKREYLIKIKIEYITRLNGGVVCEIDKLLDVLNESTENNKVYVDLIRINELLNSNQTSFYTTTLVRLCEELNDAYKKSNYITIPLLVRAVMDHVPPIFNQETFKQVVLQHGTKSFKESLTHLDDSLRKIADAILHSQIRNKEVLSNHTQIDFRADLDVLLSEVCRILKRRL